MSTPEFMTLALTAAMLSAGEAILAMIAALLLSTAAIMVGVMIVVLIMEYCNSKGGKH